MNPEDTPIYLGIDTGGTYTDAVLLDDKRGVVRAAKALTTRHDLSIGIQNAVTAAMKGVAPGRVKLVSLSSTLATNAVVEGRGAPVCLILIGYAPELLEGSGLEKLVNPAHIVRIAGGHTVAGDEQQPLDFEVAERAIREHAPHVTAFAISGYFSVRNPAHELRVKAAVRRLTGLPVTCGHELTTQLDAPRRAVTMAINARLVSIMQELILAVRGFLEGRGITAPLMVVRGDGSLMNVKVALERPVETLLSGPAASVIGAAYLCGKIDGVVADMGGTTTDVAVVRDGVAVLNREGATVGGWRTMVEAMDIHTTGLGGDSEVRADSRGRLALGPRRVVPLSMLAQEYPAIVEELRAQLGSDPSDDQGQFVMRLRPPPDSDALGVTGRGIWEQTVDAPAALTRLVGGGVAAGAVRFTADELVRDGTLTLSSFTPTDAAHVLGLYRAGNMEAARLGARLWGRQLGIGAETFCRQVVRQVTVQAGYIVLEASLAEAGRSGAPGKDSLAQLFFDRALGVDGVGNVAVKASLKLPLVGVGAPACTYFPALAKQLNTPLHVPEHAEVANAIGAVAGRVVQTVRITVRKPAGVDSLYRVYAPFGVRDFAELEEAVAYARRHASRIARRRAEEVGAAGVEVHLTQENEVVDTLTDRVHLGTEVIGTAVGWPRLGDAQKETARA